MQGREQVVIKTAEVSVRELSLEPFEEASWHYHNQITDHMYCLAGAIGIQCRDPDETFSLQPGQRCTIPVGRVHRVVNQTDLPAIYLLVQGVGRYDFNVVAPLA